MTDNDKDDSIEWLERCACSLAVHDGRNWKDMTKKNKKMFLDRAKVVIREYNRYLRGSDSKYPHAGSGSRF